MNNKYFFLIVLFFIIPLEIPIIKIGSKPVDLVLSDFLLIFVFSTMVIYFLLNKKLYINKNIRLAILIISMYIFFGVTIAVANSIFSRGEILPIISSIKFFKPMLFVLVGVFLAQKEDFISFFDDNIVKSILFISILLIITTFIDPRFPRLLWGESIFNIRIYGFPNSSMSFFSFISLFLLSKYFHSKNIFYLSIYLLLSVNIVFSLSRSSTIVLIVGSIILMSFYMSKKKILYYLSISFFITAFFVILLKDNPKISPVFELVNDRIQRTLGNTENEASSGRFDIWKESIRIIADKPFLGYGFEPFSNFSIEYDTPHQQYLEVIHKTGIVGFLMYSFIIFYMLLCLYNKYKSIDYNDNLYITTVSSISGMLALSIGNITQPNFSYSMTGNLIFFIFGIIMVNEKKIKINRKRNNNFETTITRS